MATVCEEAANTSTSEQVVKPRARSLETSLNEDLLLGDCSFEEDASYCNSTKSEEELLATPCPSNARLVQTEYETHTEEEHASVSNEISLKKMESNTLSKNFANGTNFLDNVHRMERVQNATAFLSQLAMGSSVHDTNLHSFNKSHNDSHNSSENAANYSRLSSNSANTSTSSVGTQTALRNLLDEIHESSTVLDDIEEGINMMEISGSVAKACSTPMVRVADGFTSCQPSQLPTCEKSVQSQVSAQSASCSPIKFENLDISIQNAVKVQTAMCSPIAFPGHDVSVQNCAEFQEAVCSPIVFRGHDVSVQNCAEFKSAQCSPMRLPQCDVSIQNEPLTASVMCSPLRHSTADVSTQNVACMHSGWSYNDIHLV